MAGAFSWIHTSGVATIVPMSPRNAPACRNVGGATHKS